MLNNKITGVLIPTYGKATAVTIDRSLDGYYKALDCDCVDIVTRYIGGRAFAIVCDDEGLLKDDMRVSAINTKGEPVLIGKLFVCHSDGENLISLDSNDIVYVLQHTATAIFSDGTTGSILKDVEFFA